MTDPGFIVQDHELATAIDRFLPGLNAKRKYPVHILKTLDALVKCRTEYMGGHIEACQGCAQVRTAYNSCRNRHCPKCGSIDKEKWIMKRELDLIPAKYFHVVFTVPDKLNELFMYHNRLMYNLLFTTVWDVMKDFGGDKKWIGGKLGMTAILHTWGQNLQYHPHLHLIVPGGALMPNGKWKHARNRGKYLFTVEMLSNVFRARFVKALRLLKKEDKLSLPIPKGLFDNDWGVYAKQPFGGPKQVINYLGRYTHRTAISNDRILSVDDKEVTFAWRDYRNNYKKQVSSLKGEDFLRLFCQHIVPAKFTRIRHYGLLSSACKKKALALIRASLKVKPPVITAADGKTNQEMILERMGIQSGVCKCCGGLMVIIQILPNQYRKTSRAPPCKLYAENIN